MAYSDGDYDYEDDEEYVEDDESYLDYTNDYEDDDTDDAAAARRRSSVSGRISPFANTGGRSSLPGSGSRFGNSRFRMDSSSDDEDDEDDEPVDRKDDLRRRLSAADSLGGNRPTTSSRFGNSRLGGSSSTSSSRSRISPGGENSERTTSGRFGNSSFQRPSTGGASSSSGINRDDLRSRIRPSGGAAQPSDSKSDSKPKKPAASKPPTSRDRDSLRGSLLGATKDEPKDEKPAEDKKEDSKPEEKSGGGRFGGFRRGGGNAAAKSEGAEAKNPDEKSEEKSGGGIGGRFGGLRRGGNAAKSEDTEGKKSAEKSEEKSGGGRFGGLRRGGNAAKSEDAEAKKPEEKAEEKSGGGRFGGLRRGGNAAKSEDTEAKKPEEKGGSGGGRFGGLRRGGGNAAAKSEDAKAKKPEEKAEEKSGGGRFGGLRRGGNAAKSEDAKAKKPEEKAEEKSGGGVGLGRFRRGGGNAAAKGGESEEKKPAAEKAEDKKQAKKPSPSPLGKARAQAAKDKKAKEEKSAKSAKDDKKSGDGKVAAAATVAGVGILGRVGGIFGGGGESKPTSAPRRGAQPKVPQAAGEGLTLDNYLDILGVGLVFFSLVIGFSALSAEQAAISGLLTIAGETFGWGAAAVPLVTFVGGMWLIVRHFGEDAPTIDPIRLVGAILAFVSMLVVFQYIDTFSYRIGTEDGSVGRDLLQARLNWSVELQDGGGRIGVELYFFFLNLVGDPGVIIIAIFVLVIAGMLMTRLTASEIVFFFAGMWRSWRDGVKQRAIQRRAERQLREQQALELAADQAAAQAEMTEVVEAEPEPEPIAPPAPAATQDRRIRFNRGGQSTPLTPATAQASASPMPPPAPNAQNTANANGNTSNGGLFSRFGRSNGNGQSNNGANAGAVAASVAGGVIGAAMSNSTYEPLPMPDEPLPHDDSYSHFAPPVQPSWNNGRQPAWQQNGASAPQPAQPQPQPVAPPPTPIQPQQPAAATDQQPAAEVDPMQARQDRLNALRTGQTGPLSQSRLAQTRQNAPSLQPVIVSGGDNVDVGDMADEHDSTPVSQLPSVQPAGQTEPYQQRLAAVPQQPVSSKVMNQTRAQRPSWRTPDYRTLLSSGSEQEFDREALLRQAKIIEDTLQGFGAPGRVVEVNTGPVITQFGVEPDYLEGRGGKKQRVKVSAIAALDKDLQLALGARSIRVEAPVPGKGYVGVEVPNAESTLVSLRDVMDSPGFLKHKTPLAIALGQSVSGAPVSADLASMPHLLIAGTTGSGKSVCVNSIITSIVSRNTPEQVKFIMVDPKRVELIGYNGIPHLVAPVVVELERIVGVLKWVTREMDDRYKLFSQAGARNIVDYNQHRDPNSTDEMPYIVVIIDELADLMMMAPEETERTITRIAALARATGIHLVIATQRPSADVVTGLIKANFPARIAFAVASNTDSRVILDQPGAERLLGKGDMLYMSGNSPAPVRLQGVFVSDMESQNIVRYWKLQQPADTTKSAPKLNIPSVNLQPRTQENKQQGFWDNTAANNSDDSDIELTRRELTGDVQDGAEDELYEKAVELVRRLDKASISLLQRRLRIGYTRAARLIDVMEARGVIGGAKEGSSKPRDVLPE